MLHFSISPWLFYTAFRRSGSKIYQHWFNVLCLLGWLILTQRRLICEAVCSHNLWEHKASHTGSWWATGTFLRQLRARIYLAYLVSWHTQFFWEKFRSGKQWNFTSMLKESDWTATLLINKYSQNVMHSERTPLVHHLGPTSCKIYFKIYCIQCENIVRIKHKLRCKLKSIMYTPWYCLCALLVCITKSLDGV